MDTGAALVVAVLLATVNMKIIDYVFAPIRTKLPDLDLWWVTYVALATGFVLAWASGVNLFPDVIQDPVAGKVLSGILVGGGASLIHDIFDNRG